MMSEPSNDNLWPESPLNESKDLSEGEKDDLEEEEEADEEEEDDVDSAVYEAELEQEIDEEEVQEEVDKLQEESERPIEELIALYGLPEGSAAGNSNPGPVIQEPSLPTVSGRRTRFATRRRAQDSEKGAPSPQRRCLEGTSNQIISQNEASTNSSVNGIEGKEDDAIYSKVFGTDATEDDDDNDEDFDPGIDEKKMVQVGEAYQACVPTDLNPYPENERHKHDLSLIWDPAKLPQEQVEKYLYRVYSDDMGDGCLAPGVSKRKSNPVADDENLLYLLQRCDYNTEEAFLRRKCQNVDEKAFPDYMSLWTEEEVANFERGILHYGKNFHLIHAHKLCKRDVPQLVEFYYWWKKSARYEHFIRAFKLDRRIPSQFSSSNAASAVTASQQDDEGGAVCVDADVSHVNGTLETSGEEFLECAEEVEEKLISRGEGISEPEEKSSGGELPAYKPWDPNREKFDYEMPRRMACPVPRQKSPAKGSTRPKRASIMACL